MNESIAVALIAFAGTVIGSLAGVAATARLTTHRLDRLERKVDLHNNAVERLTVMEWRVRALEGEHRD